MADPFSALAGAVSIFDVAIRFCKSLQNARHAYREAPQEVEQLRDIVINLESVLRNLRLWVAEYHSSKLATQYHQSLPEAVKDCIREINTCLEDLSNLLPSPDESRQFKERSRWVLQKRQIAKLQQRLEGQQKILGLCLQTVRQRNDVKFHNKLEEVESLQRKELEQAYNLRKGQDLMNQQLDGFTQNLESSITETRHLAATTGSVVNNQNRDSQKLDNINSTLTHLRLADGSIDSNTMQDTLTRDTLTRLIRREMRGSMMPLIEQSFRKHNASNEHKLDTINQSLEMLSADVGKMLSVAPDESCCGVDLAQSQHQEVPMGNGSEHAARDLQEGSTTTARKQDRGIRFSRFDWQLKLPIGKLSVRITIRTRNKAKIVAQAYKIQKRPFSRRYHFTLTFQPSEYLLRMRGFMLLYKIKQDHQSTYPVLCPTVTSFNVVQEDADVIRYARCNYIDGLKNLFTERLASPNDRDLSGNTALEWAVSCGHVEACQLLLGQGANPDDRSLTLAMFGLYICKPLFKKHELSKSDEEYIRVIRALLNGGLELSNVFVNTVTMVSSSTAEELGDMFQTENQRTKKICRSLRELGLDPNDECHSFGLRDDTSEKLLLILCMVDHLPWPGVYAAIDWLCELGVDANGTSQELRPLRALFSRGWSEERAERVMELAVLLLAYGADPCALDNSGGSVLNTVAIWGWIDEFTEALSRYDIDLADVVEETHQRQWDFFNPVAESTAVEDSVQEGPSTKGLSQRRVILGSDDGQDGTTEGYSAGDLIGDSLEVTNSLNHELRNLQFRHTLLKQLAGLRDF